MACRNPTRSGSDAFRTQARLQVLNLLDRRNVRDWSLLLVDGVYRKAPREATPFLPARSRQLQW